MTDPALDMSIEAMEVPTVPERPYLSTQIGCSELAPLMIALGTWDGMPEHVVAWCKLAAERAAFGTKTVGIPSHLKSPEFGPVWCAKNARKVRTAVGPLPYCIAVKAGVRERDEQEDYQKSGLALEADLLRKWIATLRADPDCAIDADSVRTQHEVLAMYPAEWGVRVPSVRHTVERRLVTYLDSWGNDVVGERVVVNAKCSRDVKSTPAVPDWIQMQGEIACCRASVGVLVYGQQWGADYISGDPRDRPVEAFPIEPDATAERAILATVEAAWTLINDVRMRMVTKKGGA